MKELVELLKLLFSVCCGGGFGGCEVKRVLQEKEIVNKHLCVRERPPVSSLHLLHLFFTFLSRLVTHSDRVRHDPFGERFMLKAECCA